MTMIRAAIIGYGNIGKAVHEAINECQDITLVSIVSSQDNIPGANIVKNIDELRDVDVAILCSPSRLVPEIAASLLAKGICTVDSYDIHSSIVEVRSKLAAVAKEHECAAITAAGWDPGSDSVVRALLMAMVPKGITYTNFGPGMSMGHTVAVKAISGVRDALSMTIPVGTGIHRRMVYVELEPGTDFEQVSEAIKQDAYFVHDETHVFKVDSVDALKDVGHGVNLSRKGVSGVTNNQRVDFNMSINNPALTGQILVSSARAVVRQKAGCYTMIEIAPIDFLVGDRDTLIRELV
ncbi:diaminopimelate dehydrogenase [Lachnospiraceae bacterium OttesenSCG-928-D06]|nr:diaminopimelate dehydrogenase [Lachnospiraceae bacterium OttesenSCG-928-D06]